MRNASRIIYTVIHTIPEPVEYPGDYNLGDFTSRDEACHKAQTTATRYVGTIVVKRQHVSEWGNIFQEKITDQYKGLRF